MAEKIPRYILSQVYTWNTCGKKKQVFLDFSPEACQVPVYYSLRYGLAKPGVVTSKKRPSPPEDCPLPTQEYPLLENCQPTSPTWNRLITPSIRLCSSLWILIGLDLSPTSRQEQVRSALDDYGPLGTLLLKPLDLQYKIFKLPPLPTPKNLN